MKETPVQFLGWEDLLKEGKGYPLQYSGMENSMDCSPWGPRVRHHWATFTFLVVMRTEATHTCRVLGFHGTGESLPHPLTSEVKQPVQGHSRLLRRARTAVFRVHAHSHQADYFWRLFIFAPALFSSGNVKLALFGGVMLRLFKIRVRSSLTWL